MSKVVFGKAKQYPSLSRNFNWYFLVGNVPYTMGEEQLIDVFKSVGQVVGFRYCHSTLHHVLPPSYRLKSI